MNPVNDETPPKKNTEKYVEFKSDRGSVVLDEKVWLSCRN